MEKSASTERNFAGFLDTMRRNLRPGDPLVSIIDGFKNSVGNDPRLLQTKVPIVPAVMIVYAQAIRRMLAERLHNAALESNDYLVVNVEQDWRIKAEIETAPPYHVYVSVNLLLFSLRLGELLTAGLGIRFEGGEAARPGIDSDYSVDEVGRRTRALLDGFIKHRTIPDQELPLGQTHGVLGSIVTSSIISSVIGHEFGHVVIAESHRNKTAVPFADYAEARLESAFQKLLKSDRHDPDGRVGLSKLSKSELNKTYESWRDEITADIVGASLALDYHRRTAPWSSMPDIVGTAGMGVHFGMIAQLMLQVYHNYVDPRVTMISRTHPPIDFRLYCVQLWLFGDHFLEVVRPWTEYVQSMLKVALAGA